MRVFISADMEGVTGIATPADVVKGEPDYDDGQELMVGDVNAAVEGAAEAGADEILVNDSHSSMTNLPRARLDDRATLVRGNTKPRSMMQGLSADHDVVFFVGYHAKAGTPTGVLNHTYVGHELVRARANGAEVGELGCNARLAFAEGVPVGLVTGDEAATAEARDELESPETVAVKRGTDRFSAVCRPPSETRPDIRAAAKRAVQRARDGDLGVPSVTEPSRIAFEWSATNHAERASRLPGITREGGRTTVVEADSYPEAFESAIAMLRAGSAGRDELYG